jgi:phenylpyruvate tautomerase PptA (4-oxalocrotonate tautomerase family)
MALATLDVLAGWSREDKRRLLDGAMRALVTALRVPDRDPTVRLVEHNPDDVIVPPIRSPRYTVVTVTMFAGRSDATKRALYTGLVTELGAAGVPAGDLLIVLHDVSVRDWSVAAGLPADEVEHGFVIDV